jgi:hypothetical protein
MTRLIKSELRDRKGPGAAAYHRPVRRRSSAVASDLDLDSSLPGTGLRDPNGVPEPFPIVIPLVLSAVASYVRCGMGTLLSARYFVMNGMP